MTLGLATLLREHLAMAKRHLSSGNRVITRQRQLITKLEADGHDTREARALLAQFEGLLALHLADRDRLFNKVSKVGGRMT